MFMLKKPPDIAFIVHEQDGNPRLRVFCDE